MTTSPERAFEALRTAFAAKAAAERIEAVLTLEGERLALGFAGQEDARPEQLAEAFASELAAAGMDWDELRELAHADEAGLARRRAVLEHALARLRTLLVEYHSYMSGGLGWPFPGGSPALRARGLAIYRFPARAAVDVEADGTSVRIRFHPGALGEVTSSGIWVPTRVRGDFRATLAYELGLWRPGPEAASFALFAQDEPSTLRYYAQRRSAGDGAHELVANFTNTHFGQPIPVHDARGELRVERRGTSVRLSHRERGAWTELGRHAGDPASDVVLGAKIWSGGSCDGLEARLLDLTIDGELPAEQIPPVPVRPDPRGGDRAPLDHDESSPGGNARPGAPDRP